MVADTSFVPAPAGFLWGAATAAHQVEGGNTNSSGWVNEHGGDPRIAEVSGDACDSYHHYPQDIRLLAEAGLTAYRFSLEWARIEPAKDEFSLAQLAHYRRMIDTCREYGVEPVVTLQHFTVPAWQAAEGGWYAPDVVDRFRRYTERAASILGDVRWVITINEPNMMVNQDDARIDTEIGMNWPGPSPHAARTIAAAHHAAMEVLRGLGHTQAGWSVANQVYQAYPGCEQQRDEWAYWREDFFLEQARGDDFLGVQSYLRTVIGPDGPVPFPEDVERTLTGWEYYPPALGEALIHSHQVTGGIPLMVTENGIATADDQRRIDYTTGALSGMADAIAAGCDVRGYLHWSLLDNYEWGSYAPTFGLIAVDRTTFERTPKPSLSWLGGLARAGQIPVLRERPEYLRPDQLTL